MNEHDHAILVRDIAIALADMPGHAKVHMSAVWFISTIARKYKFTPKYVGGKMVVRFLKNYEKDFTIWPRILNHLDNLVGDNGNSD